MIDWIKRNIGNILLITAVMVLAYVSGIGLALMFKYPEAASVVAL